MGVGITGNCLHWSRPSLHRCSSSPQPTLPSSVFSSSRTGWIHSSDRYLACHVFRQAGACRSPFLGARSRSLDDFNSCGGRSRFLPRVFDGVLDNDDANVESDDEFIRGLEELGVGLPADDSTSVSPISSVSHEISPLAEPPWRATPPEPPAWINGGEIVPACMEMTANRVDLPLSLRIIKRKKRWEEGLKEAGESARCSVKKAFSSMVFIVRELQSYTLQMREMLFYENLEGVLARVQGEMNASFVWLFQQIFSCTPTLMVYVMLLLANFTVYSIGHNSTFAAVSPGPPAAVEQEYQQTQQHRQPSSRLDASSIKSFSFSRTASVGGGGGGNAKPVAGATGDARSDSQTSIVPADGRTNIGLEGSETATDEEEKSAWNKIVEEASRMQASSLMDFETLQQLVSPVTVEMEHEDYSAYSHTELMYLQALSQDPENVLLLSNFAQFLFLVLHDQDRAEYYFKRAARVKPTDGEALYRYAMFLWTARKDLEAAEEAYVGAMEAEPGNSHYAANYAHFLWSTGGEETCYPLDGSDAC